ncbi:SPX domain-containing protein [Cavenderia fasciculata]|uniref:SPX domain-containing protein n=1 Tax=Cavenderia fasciculata TaxID=261658 RepID=F4QD26_CACFS|nr:SPX domain-containing protein [Cavenderia fasciculata]EGG13707.1 SPX domain-containing protein [Cavenderia fasciculata]|eukprot:XP_004350411.1 SPX domain-containing protein [Cavenderia fasciculata]
MKFGKYLERHQVSEWRKKYVYYKLFKKQIKAIKRAILEDSNQANAARRTLSLTSIRGGNNNNNNNGKPTIIENNNNNNGGGEEDNEAGQDPNLIAMNQLNGGNKKPAPTKAGANQEREQSKFDQMVLEEFEKVNTFYKEREQEFYRQFESIKQKLMSLKDQGMLASKKKKPKDGSGLSGSMSTTPNLVPSPTMHAINDTREENNKKFNLHLFRRSHRLSRSPSQNQLGSNGGNVTDSPGSTPAGYTLPAYDPENHQSPLAESSAPQNMAQKALAHASKAETYWPKVKYTKVKRALKRALEEIYREIEVLKEYVILNHTAFRKIFKKYDKVLQQSKSGEAMANVNSQYFVTSKILQAIEHDIEKLYTDCFKPGNRRDAMGKLRVQLNYHAPPRIIFFTGLLSGGALMLFIFCVRYMIGSVSIFYFDEPYPIDFLSMFILFRALALPIIMVWYFGILMYICSIKKINHVFILGWDPRTHTNHYHILLLASVLSFMWSVGLYLYVYLSTHIDGYIPIIFPFILIMSILVTLVCPLNIMNRSSRYWLIHTFGRIFSAPFLAVKFKDFFFGDQLTSLAVVLSDLQYIVCYFVYDLWTHDGKCWAINPYCRPILVSVPPLLRALQSVRRYRDSKQNIHMMNFCKYAMSILSTIASALAHAAFTKNISQGGQITLIVLWLIIASISTLISCSWDFLMDWGILQTNSRNFLLRDHLLYRPKSIYYFAIVSNIIMRVSWAVNLSFESYSSRQKELIVLITSILEVTRRFQWNFFRLENEHLSNVGKFRAFDLRIPEVYSPLAAIDTMVKNVVKDDSNSRSQEEEDFSKEEEEDDEEGSYELTALENDMIECINTTNTNNQEISTTISNKDD